MSSLPTNAGEHVVRMDHNVLESAYTKFTQYTNGVQDNTNSNLILIRKLEREFCSGRNIPDFHKRRNSGELLPYTVYDNISHRMIVTGPSTYSWGGTILPSGNSRTFTRTWVDGSMIPLFHYRGTYRVITDPTNFCNSLAYSKGLDPTIYTQEAAARIYSRGWDGLTFVAELRQVVSMFTRMIPNLLGHWHAWVAFCRRSKDNIDPLTSSLVNDWLQGRYGWRVLMYDIRDIQELVENMEKEQKTRVKERVGATHTFKEIFLESYEDASIQILQQYVTETEVSLRGSIIADVIPPKIQTNFFVTGWELISFSFVLDWFISFGKWLSAMSFLALEDEYTASASRYFTGKQQVLTSAVFKTPATGLVYSYENFSDTVVNNLFVVKDRRPVIVPYLPRTRLNLDFFKVTDLVALLIQALGKR